MTVETIAPPPLLIGQRIHRRHGYPWTIEIRHGEPDPIDYLIHARNALEAVRVVARMRALGRGAAIVQVDA